MISVFDRVENIVGKGEIACTSNFSFSHNVFKRLLSQARQKLSLCGNGLNSANEKILALSKLKAFADNKLNVIQNNKVVFHWIDNIVGKGENAGYQHFLLFPQCFQKAFSSWVSKPVIVW